MENDYYDCAIIWFVDGSKKYITKKNIYIEDIVKYLINDEISSIYIEKKVEKMENG